jgi:ankyrin repeat protein
MSAALSLPDSPNLEWLRKAAKRRLDELRGSNPQAQLAEAQLELARRYGFPSWRALKAHIEGLSVDGQLFAAAKQGDNARLGALLDQHPEKVAARIDPYQHTLLHAAAQAGQLAAVNLLLERGAEVNAREKGDNTYPIHWAAAAGSVLVVRRLIEAGGDVIGAGDDHELEVIGWASCWEGCDDAAHRAVVDLLLAAGARQHIFSAIALRQPDAVRRIVASDPSALNRRMSRNEDHQLPLHFAVRMQRKEMVELLLELGADPLGVDASGNTAVSYARTPEADRPVMKAIRAFTAGELTSAARGSRPTHATSMDLVASVALGDWPLAEGLLQANPELIQSRGSQGGVLHLMAKRGDRAAASWLLDHGADPNALWSHWDADVAPLHLAVLGNHPELVRLLLARGADPTIKDSKHESDPLGWATFFGHDECVRVFRERGTGS